ADVDLSDLAFAGVAEFARQWFLLARRSPYEPGSGQHRLWLKVGGSAGQSGRWALDVNEGQVGDRIWNVQVATAEEVQRQEGERQAATQQEEVAEQRQEKHRKVMAALDRLDPDRAGVARTPVRDAAGLSGSVWRVVFAELVELGEIDFAD